MEWACIKDETRRELILHSDAYDCHDWNISHLILPVLVFVTSVTFTVMEPNIKVSFGINYVESLTPAMEKWHR
jgi:hypothetical protein